MAVTIVLLNLSPAPVILPPVLSPDNASGTDGQNADGIGFIEDAETVRVRPSLTLSHDGHFHPSAIAVSISASTPDAVIYYTLDGSEPTYDSQVYTGPIELEPPSWRGQSIAVYPLKAAAVTEDDTSLTLVHTYFIGGDFDDRFDVMVFSLSTDDEYLYDYDIGILVEGRLREEYRKNNPGAWINPPDPANFNIRGMDGERPIYVEVFESGKRVLAQPAGVRVHGGWSRASNQKSLRLIARNAYEVEPGQGRFRYNFFPDDVRADLYGTPITRYDQLVLSNNANDRDFAMLRQEVNYNLSLLSGFRVTPPLRAAAVFINGEYYGFAWLEVAINEQYLEDVYSAPTRDFQIVGDGEWWVRTEDETLIAAIGEVNDFYNKDFTDDKVLADFNALVDIDNLLHYYAFQTFVGNRDWPGGNLKRWRYIGPQTDEEGNPLDLAPELDGRWRYIMYDLDFLMSLYEDNVRANSPSFKDYLTRNNDRYSYMLTALFARPDMADKFAMYACDIISNVVTPENVSKYTKERYGEAYKEIGYALDARKYAAWVSRDSIEFNHSNMVVYTEARSAYFLQGMRDHFGWDDEMFTVRVSGGDAVIGTQAAASSTYFAHLTIPVKPALSKYAVFDHWVLNGEIIYTDEITVSAADAIDGVVSITLVTREEAPTLSITQAYGSSSRNGAALQNASDTAIETTHLYFTDDLHNPFMWAMPLATVEPGGTLEFAGRGSNDALDIHRIRMGFNVREGRVLYLCGEDGSVLDWMVVNAAP